MNKNNRRTFITQTSLLGLGLTMHPSLLKSFKENIFVEKEIDFIQTPLLYNFNALEPFIDATTMEIHYTRHATSYLKNLLEGLKEKNVQNIQLQDIFNDTKTYTTKIINNAGGHYNHELFWRCMQPQIKLPIDSKTQPASNLKESIELQFGNLENFKNLFEEQGKKIFGSGWVWLIVNKDFKLEIVITKNQDNPLMDTATNKGFPLFGVDVWEHAYYLKYQNKRADYLKNWWNITNWEYIEKRYDAYLKINC